VSLKIRRDDRVQVIAGKDAGKTGKVLRVEPKKNRVYVEGLNIVKRHQRPRSLKDTQRGGKVGGVIEKEGPIHTSNVMLVDPKEDRPTRIGIERASDGKRVRVTKRSNTRIEE
jgi:large subunit ribosomal protein L24